MEKETEKVRVVAAVLVHIVVRVEVIRPAVRVLKRKLKKETSGASHLKTRI